MSFAKPIRVEEYYNTTYVYYDFNYISVFCFSSNKGYVDQVDLWVSRLILKGLVNAISN